MAVYTEIYRRITSAGAFHQASVCTADQQKKEWEEMRDEELEKAKQTLDKFTPLELKEYFQDFWKYSQSTMAIKFLSEYLLGRILEREAKEVFKSSMEAEYLQL